MFPVDRMWKALSLLLVLAVVIVKGKPPHIIFVVADDLGKSRVAIRFFDGQIPLSVCQSRVKFCLSPGPQAFNVFI